MKQISTAPYGIARPGPAALFVLLTSAVVGCKSSLVGAECRAGFSQCESECVNLSADFRHCGECGNNCGRYMCAIGECTRRVRPDAAAPPIADDAAAPEGGVFEAGARDAGPGAPDGAAQAGGLDGGALDSNGLPGCGLGERQCAGVCIDPLKARAHCGVCDNACAASDVCAAGSCARVCEDPLAICDEDCVNLASDAEHCGRCHNRCGSGICEGGTCADAVAGQAVVIGHDFTSANNAMRRIAGNAVFLARGAPVRVLSYQADAAEASVTGVEQAIDFVKSEIGREWLKTEADEALLPMQLAEADVLVVHAQVDATHGTLARLGQAWASALAQFSARGGVLVLFEAPSERNDGTFRLLSPANIFSAQSRSGIEDQPLRIETPGLGVALRVPERYLSASQTVHFTAPSIGMPIAIDREGRAVVIHRVIVPPTAASASGF
jgi:hypothetical protein